MGAETATISMEILIALPHNAVPNSPEFTTTVLKYTL